MAGNSRSFKRLLAGFASTLALVAIAPAHAQTTENHEIAIEAQSLGGAINALSRQSGVVIVVPSDLVDGKSAPAISGDMTVAAALETLLADTGQEAVEEDSGVIVVREAAAVVEKTPTSLDSRGRPVIADTIVITGTNIRGAAPDSSPYQVFDRDALIDSGVTTTEQFIRLLPQNFGGGSTEFTSVGLPNDSNSRANNTFGASANLRGLGSRATLVLLNGSRMAPTSTIGDYVDLSLIPVSAVERVEVLSDGASSIYGGDAVAGVINFVLRDDFDGAETAVRYGTVTDGDMDEYRISQTLGTAWNRGNILASYEYFSRENLTLADRPDIVLFPASSTNLELPVADLFDVLPRQERHSAVLSGRQEITSTLSVTGSALYSQRSTERTRFNPGGTVDRFDATSQSATLSFGADYEISPRWLASLDGTFSRVDNDSRNRELARASGALDPDRLRDTASEVWSVDAQVNGELFALPGGRIKSAFGAHVRQESFDNAVDGRLSSEGARDVSAAYGELLLPLVSDANAVPGVRRLEINLSGRIDDYSDFGTSTNPKIGAVWSPADGLKIRGSYSTSFAPPPLGRAFALDRIGQIFPHTFILDALGLESPDPSLTDTNYFLVSGTASDLKPETSRTFTGGFDHVLSTGGHTWTSSVTYYDIEFEDRLGAAPIPGNQGIYSAPGVAYADPTALPPGTVIFFPSDAEVQAALDSVSQFATYFGADAENVGILNFAPLVRNLSTTTTRGLDVQVNYEVDTRVGRLTAGLNANYIIDFIQQASDTTPSVEVLNTYLNPVDLHVRGRLGLNREAFTGNVFVNYIDSYKTDSTVSAAPIDSWTTVDLSLSYDLAGHANWLGGTVLNFSVSNLLEEGPPASPTDGVYSIIGYDPTNASPLGRFVALEVRKTF